MKNSPGDKSFFMGKVTASVSHELQNVLAIIRETAGLMNDFLMMGDNCPDLGDRLENSLSSIKNQVTRGVNLTSNLNSFAHTADHLSSVIDVRATLERLLLLTDRLTRNKGFEVILDEGDSPSMECDPLGFQSLCFLSLETLISVVSSGQTIHLIINNHDKGCRITFSCPGTPEIHGKNLAESSYWPLLVEACSTAQVTLRAMDGHPGVCLIF